MKHNLQFSVEHSAIILVSILVLLTTLTLFFTVLLRFTQNKLTRSFFLLLIPFAFWQANELLIRLSGNSADVLYWCRLFNPFVNLIPPVGMHFVIVFTRLTKLKKPLFLALAIYLPSLFFFLCNYGGIISFNIYPSEVWRWVFSYQRTPIALANAIWLLASTLFMLIMLFKFAFVTKHHNNTLRIQARLIFIGLLIPGILSIITEFVYPFILFLHPIPLLASTFTLFPVCVFIALYKYELFMFSPKYAWSNIVENMNEGIMIIDFDRKVQYVNSHFLRITGYLQEELLGSDTILLLADKGDHSLLEEQMELRRLGISDKYLLGIRRKNGDAFTGQVSSTPYFDKKKMIIGSVAIIEDLSETIELEKALDRKVKELNLFIYRTYHELKGPMATIEGLCELGIKNADKDPPENYLKMISRGSQKLVDVLSDLQRVSFLSHSRIEPVAVDLLDEIEAIQKDLRILPTFKNIQFKYEIQVRKVLFTDRSLIIAILHNLLSNAVNFADLRKSSPTVGISVTESDSRFEIIVEDNGIGIEDVHQNKVWDMFFRASESVKGTGLGLYIVKSAIERLKGSISLTSKKDVGSKFTVSLMQYHFESREMRGSEDSILTNS